MADMRCAFRSLIREAEGERPLGKVTHIWNDNIKNDVSRCLLYFVSMGMVLNLRVP
jgi:hypothetical protein